jgi:hypothetical protein
MSRKKKYKVGFEIEGSMLGDDTPLTKEWLKKVILYNLDEKLTSSYYGNREIDTKIKGLKIKKIK